MRVLVVAAHPDDEVLGCGGSIARLRREGNEIVICILGEGGTSRFQTREEGLDKGTEKAKDLQSGMSDAAAILGAGGVESFKLPDNRFDSVELLNIIKIVEKKKREFQPEVVFTHHPGDLNIDHVITHKAVSTAFRPAPGEKCKAIYSFEIASSTEWASPQNATGFRPNYFIKLSEDDIRKKLLAMEAYKTEMKDWPHPRSIKSVEYQMRLRGSQVGVDAAEAFAVERIIY